MSVYYIKEQGTYVKKMDKRIVVEKNGKTLVDVPIVNITNMSVFGNVQVTTQVLHMMMEEGIDVSFFTYSGKYVGQIAADNSKNIFLRFAQYECYQNMDRRLEISRQIVRNKVGNQIALIKSYDWTESDYDYKADIESMNRLLLKLPEAETSNEIMGIEGSCSAVYFNSFGKMFRCKIKFDKRNRRPPKDPINIILSLAYTLLTKEVSAALDSESFETYLGFLHGIRYGRKSLALDIVEEFRQPAVDRLVLRLFNKQMLSEFDFENEEKRIVLTEDGFKKFCREYEKWMKQPICKNDSRSFRSFIAIQANCLKHAIKENTAYVPFDWALYRKGDTDVFDNL